ncbi:MAG TPA: YtxH domain-containing protein [Vicinamibacterales bacterium]|nr:YtxH domain-containing protein [Vicinamibacterales bacterium]
MAHQDEGPGGGSLIAAFVIGAMTGAAVALLLAPASGEEVRRIISDKAREGRDKAEEAARQGREFVQKQREHIVSAVDRGREAYQKARTTMRGEGGGETV